MSSKDSLKDACPEMRRSMRPARDQFSIDREKFDSLDLDGRKLIKRWSRRASRELELRPDHPFQPFIYAWIALNGWAACCSGTDRDQLQVEAMAADPSLETEFQAWWQADPKYRRSAETFRDQWPIFKAADLRSRRIRPRGSDRREVVDHYLDVIDPPIERAPSCYPKHVTEGYPLDWAHTVDAIYRVRCNLFHGEKSLDSEMDKAIVSAAADVLVPFLARLVPKPETACR
jgi:hypothetical protein